MKVQIFYIYLEKQIEFFDIAFFLQITTESSLLLSEHSLTTTSQIGLMYRDSRKFNPRDHNSCELSFTETHKNFNAES